MSSRRLPAVLVTLLAAGLAAACTAVPPAAAPTAPATAPAGPTAAPELALEYLGRAVLPTGRRYVATRIGGLSGLVRDDRRGVYYAVSDAAGEAAGEAVGPGRFYTLEIDLADGRLGPGGARVVAVAELFAADGAPLPAEELDPEGIALTSAGELWISSEGQARRGVPPFVDLFGRDGRRLRSLPVPAHYLPQTAAGAEEVVYGVRHNRAFEALALSADGRHLWVAAEDALAQDGPVATPEAGSLARLLRWDLRRPQDPPAEWVYPVEPVPERSPLGGLEVNSLVELLALPDGRLLALERSWVAGGEHGVRLFLADPAGATPVTGAERLGDVDGEIVPVAKTLLLDLSGLVGPAGRKVPLDNLEGLSWGPDLADGRRTLVLVSDDNFNQGEQVTQLLAFAVAER